MSLNMCKKDCNCDKSIDEKSKLGYKSYYHALVPTSTGLECYGSNLPDHPKGSCLNPSHPLVAPNMGRRLAKLQDRIDTLDKSKENTPNE
jgi:hypothetical protein